MRLRLSPSTTTLASRYTYDNKLANEITSGKITKYIPDTAATLKGTTGICYDFSSLFAAMCRSQGIPCALTKATPAPATTLGTR